MKNIILKSEKDIKRYQGRPYVNDILSIPGFLRYFAYRNTLPGLRDLINFIFDTVQIFLILFFLGKQAASGGIFGYLFVLFISGFWNAIIYSMRQKALDLESQKRLSLLPNYFASILTSGFLIWLILVSLAIYLVSIAGSSSRLIFIGRITSSGLSLYSALYFFTSYTLLRIYIPLSLTILSRLISILFMLFAAKTLGPWAFVIGFLLENLLGMIITVKFSKKALKIKGVELINKNFKNLLTKKKFWIFTEMPLDFIKRAISFSLSNLQKFIIIFLVGKAYPLYLVEFFAFYQLISIFLLIPSRISKSLYYDLTKLLSRGRLYTLKLIIKYNLIIVMLLAIISVYLFSLIRTIPLPSRFFSLMFELDIINQWFNIYMLIFFTFGIMIMRRVLLISESHYLFIFSTLLFEYVLLIYMILSRPYFFQIGNPLLIFGFQGQISLYYFITLFVIYISGIWKKDSLIMHLAKKHNINSKLKTLKELDNIVKNYDKRKDLIIITILMKKYCKKYAIESFLDLLSENTKIKSALRISRNTLLTIIQHEDDIIKTTKELKMILTSQLGVFAEKVLILDKDSLDIKAEILKSFYHKNISSENSLINVVHPKLFSSINDIDIKIIDSDDLILKTVEKFLKDKSIEYKIHSQEKLQSSTRKKEILSLLDKVKETSMFLPEQIILKKDYLGLIPIIEENYSVKIIEIINSQHDFIKKLIRTIYLKNIYIIIRKLSKN